MSKQADAIHRKQMSVPQILADNLVVKRQEIVYSTAAARDALCLFG